MQTEREQMQSTRSWLFTAEQRMAIAQAIFDLACISAASAQRWTRRIEEVALAAAPKPCEMPGPKVAAHILDRIAERIADARVTLRAWRAEAGPAKAKSWWPAVVQDAYEAYNPDDPRKPQIAVYARRLAEMDRVLVWMTWLDRRTSRVVWGRAEGLTWRTLSERDRRSDTTLQKVYREALELIAAKLYPQPVEPNSAAATK